MTGLVGDGRCSDTSLLVEGSVVVVAAGVAETIYCSDSKLDTLSSGDKRQKRPLVQVRVVFSRADSRSHRTGQIKRVGKRRTISFRPECMHMHGQPFLPRFYEVFNMLISVWDAVEGRLE